MAAQQLGAFLYAREETLTISGAYFQEDLALEEVEVLETALGPFLVDWWNDETWKLFLQGRPQPLEVAVAPEHRPTNGLRFYLVGDVRGFEESRTLLFVSGDPYFLLAACELTRHTLEAFLRLRFVLDLLGLLVLVRGF